MYSGDENGPVLVLSDDSPASLRAWSEAILRGIPVRWDAHHLPHGWVAEELQPLHEAGEKTVALPALPALPEVTVVIPSHRHTPFACPALIRQSVALLIWVVENGGVISTPPGVVRKRRKWEGHGATRRAILAEVTTPWVLFMSDDVVPVGARFVETLLRHAQDSDWDAVVARQVPWPDADPATRLRIRAWTPFHAKTVPFAQADHVCTLYRTASLRAQNLLPVPIAEDLVWSRGLRVGLCSEAVVVHSHRRSLRAQWARTLAEHKVRGEYALPTPIPGVRQALLSVPAAAGSGLRWGLRESGVRVAEVLAMGIGAHQGRSHAKKG